MSDRIDQLIAFLTEDPGDSFIRYALAQEYQKRGQMYQARDAYLQLKESDPDYVGLYYHLGKLYEELGEKETAIETYESGIQVAKRLADFHALSELNTAKTNLEIES
jgi:tetratricopeptide (TPR) repeat protein